MNPQILIQLLGYLIQYAPQLTNLATEIQALITKIVAALRQNKEMTPEQEAAFDAHITDLKSQPWWQPDPQPAPGP